MEYTRRTFLKTSAAVVAGGLMASGLPTGAAEAAERVGFDSFSRWIPSHGGPVDSPHYLGKMVPGFRRPGSPPVRLQTPDLKPLAHRMIDGRKTFHLSCDVVKREFLPGAEMEVWGFNNSMPGPTIECVQGDRVRVIVKNNLPEPTTVHWHGLELICDMDGVPGVTQDPIPPGGTFTYDFDLHQVGTFFYHSHYAMQEAMGMVGFLIIYPKTSYEPVCDRDFGLIFQSFAILPNQNIADSRSMDWNWHTINGRCGPYTTPLLVKHGERVRLRFLDFSPVQHHSIHLHGHTYWLTGTEGGRTPSSAWVARNVTLVGVAMVNHVEFIANNPGDWLLHCHMVHHMMNHMTYPVGPPRRPGLSIQAYQKAIPDAIDHNPPHLVPGYPEQMEMHMPRAYMKKILGRREVAGMRPRWFMPINGLMTVVRVLPHDLYDRVVAGDPTIKPGEIFAETMRRVRRQRPG